MKSFRQQTSFTERLRIILLVIAAFFVVGIMGLYFSSRGFLTGIQFIANANNILNHAGTTLEAIQTVQDHLTSLEEQNSSTKLTSVNEASRLGREHLEEAVKISFQFPNVKKKLVDASGALENFEVSLEGLKGKQNITEEILVAREFIKDSQESVREAQILLKKASDETFTGIYDNRFDPLIVAGLLSTAFFAFVVIVGLSSSRRLAASLSNLTHATDELAAGNLNYQAPILEPDEFGKLTHEFNAMVNSLRDKQLRLSEAMEKVTRLQTITNSFSGTLLPKDVFDVIVEDVHRAIRADGGTISLISDDGTGIENRIIGLQTTLSKVDFNWHSPLTVALKKGVPMFFNDIETMKDEFREVYDILLKSKMSSVAYLPLITGDQIYGVLSFGFIIPRFFDEEEKEFIMALTRQCAQALHRAKLFKSATDAIQVRDEFLSIASHELRTPLTPLKLQLQNMSRQVKKGHIQVQDQGQVLKFVESSDRQVDRLINLIDDLLDVSRISAGKLTLNRENFNFGEMAEEVISHYSSQMKEAHTILTSEIDKTITCTADKVRMEQVLINLLTNAVKYAPMKPVHIRVSRNGNNARLEVIDQGQGISYENQKRIFDRFERVRDKNNIGGLGLGLYICRQIVEAHNGSISVVSEPEKGSIFTVEIPALS
jgi:signal transduction histidine kinase/HAMP domain-containing protein